MGKIRISKLGTGDERAEKERAKVRREQKEKRLTHLTGMKGGQKVVDMSATTETTEKIPETTEISVPSSSVSVPSVVARKPSKISRQHGKAYRIAKKLIELGKLYPLKEAVELVKKTSFSKFDGSVEAHINTLEKGLRGQVTLPHGTGRQIKVAIANPSASSGQVDSFENLLKKIELNNIDFDILVATPEAMPKLARVAKILGPKGLMPNPKAGTISDKPEELAKKFSSGATQFKSESEFPIIHMVIGKVSFPNKDLEENLTALISAIGPTKIKSCFLKSTMSPSVKVQI